MKKAELNKNHGEIVWLFDRESDLLPPDQPLQVRGDVFQLAGLFEEKVGRRLHQLQVFPCGVFLCRVPFFT